MQKDGKCSNCKGTGIAPECPFTTAGVRVSFLFRFLHMLSHIPLGFGDFRWAVRFHDWTGDLQERFDAPGLSNPAESSPTESRRFQP